ncbi:N-acetylneuraminate synthase family protein [Candidatus Nitrosotenuis uzonensis]|uniref:Spore coat polysaccharide biosynthesis protein SpsE n=1 Tax=Candidatus Nitrosotenuis uzonensis TaxID=1407055 RepID=A0A812F144_9ARCH|nr:N-acetylneuraminate synthase family protein [Candidatus Nitrosotenuis uzonensis]CAE6487062.1 Spore coat polysaccharide biosynthesis protein SpsE [Candidatus Nitrosotenuis uzonensis]
MDLNKIKRVIIIAEAGSNWKCGTFDEDLDQGKKLIDVAVRAGADAIKFQTYKPETIYVQDAGRSEYLLKHGIEESINDIFEHLSMPYEMIPELEKYCKKKNIMFMSTPFSVQDAKAVDPFVKIHKVASFEINHVRLLEYLFDTGKPVLISTGASTYDEIDFAVKLARTKNAPFGLLQCTSKYPCSIDALNLSVIPRFWERYKVPIGLSDHSIDPLTAPIVAVSLGAKIIEKHFTLDRKLPGPDHPFALEPDELRLMVEYVRKAEKSLGSGNKVILEEEEELRRFAKRSIQATSDIKKGDVLQEGVNFEVLRPGNRMKGLDPRELESIKGKRAKSDIRVGDGITEYE